MDGNKRPGYQYATWEGYLLDRLPVASDLEIDLNGNYDPETHSGLLNIMIRNVGASSLTGTLQCALTESGLYYMAPNGLDWHHHVLRDLLPTEHGTELTVAPGHAAVVSLAFQIEPNWDPAQCELVCFVQDGFMQPDSTFEVWQGAKVSVPGITGTAAISADQADAAVHLRPARPRADGSGTEIAFELPVASVVSLAIYDVAGRRVATLLDEHRPAGTHALVWPGEGACAGLYFCRLSAHVGGRAHVQTQQLLLTK